MKIHQKSWHARKVKNLENAAQKTLPQSFQKSQNPEKCGPKNLAPVVPEKSKF